MYKDVKYAYHRLVDTVVRDMEGLPIYIQNIWGEYDNVKADFYWISTANVIEGVPLNQLNLKPLPLGNINFKYSTYYSQRMPMREDWRQGTRARNLRIVNMHNLPVDSNSFLTKKEFVDCVLNKYDSFEKCLHEVKNSDRETCSLAFSKKFSVCKRHDNKVDLIYKSRKTVGEVRKEIELFDKFKYLKESLDEVLR